jgi:hypothetical protein
LKIISCISFRKSRINNHGRLAAHQTDVEGSGLVGNENRCLKSFMNPPTGTQSTMDTLLRIKAKTAVYLYLLLDIFCVGAGMGVPIFCILLGFPLGWYITKRTTLAPEPPNTVHERIVRYSILASLVTLFLMLLIWGRAILMLFDSSTEFQNFGHPYILYEPKASFIGWLVLMIFVSPFLQLLTIIFTSFLTLLHEERKEHSGRQHTT